MHGLGVLVVWGWAEREGSLLLSCSLFSPPLSSPPAKRALLPPRVFSLTHAHKPLPQESAQHTAHAQGRKKKKLLFAVDTSALFRKGAPLPPRGSHDDDNGGRAPGERLRARVPAAPGVLLTLGTAARRLPVRTAAIAAH
jgi:hypothetical protein